MAAVPDSIRVQQQIIPNGTALSPAFTLNGEDLIGILMPAAWTAANITFQTSPDAVTWANVFDQGGVEVVLTSPAATNYIYLTPLVANGFLYIRLRSGTNALAVNQGADRIMTVYSRSYQ
jgi:hypothetical protein